jgi:branched-chain amino acid transport system permease protein
MSTVKLPSLQTPLILTLVVAVVAAVGLLGDVTVTRVASLALISVVFVCGLFTFSGNSGVMSFGHVAFFAVGAYTTAYLTIPIKLKAALFPEMPAAMRFLLDVHTSFPAALIAGGLVAAILSIVTAPAIARLTGLQSGIATLALLIIVYNVLGNWTAVTRGSSSMIGIPPSTTPWIAALCAVVAVAIAWWYKLSRSGLQLRASREDPWAASASGIDIGRHRAFAWTLSAFLCGTAGSLYAGLLASFNISAFFLSTTFAFIVMVVVGGYLSLSGAVVGAIGISLLQELLRRLQDGQFTGGAALPAGIADLILAALLLVVLVKAPLGLLGVRELRLPQRPAPAPTASTPPARTPVEQPASG